MYIWSRDLNDPVFKIGVSSQLFTRLRHFKACSPFPQEYFIQFVIICPTTADAKQLEKILLNDGRLGKITKNPTKTEGGGLAPREFRVVSKRETLKRVLITTLNKTKNANLWLAISTFGANSWNLQFNKGGNIRGLAKPADKRTAKPQIGFVKPVKKAKKAASKASKPSPKDFKQNELMKAMMKAQKHQFLLDGVVV